MSLLKRIRKNDSNHAILLKLLEKIYPDPSELKQVIEDYMQRMVVLTGRERSNLESTPALFLTTYHPKPIPPIRLLLEDLYQNKKFTVTDVESISHDERITLNHDEEIYLKTNVINFLLGVPEQPKYREPIPSESDDPNATIIQVVKSRIIADERLTYLTPDHKQELREIASEIFNGYLTEQSLDLSRAEREKLFEPIYNDLFGLGILEPLLADPDVTEIRVLGPFNISVVKNGEAKKTNLRFEHQDHLMRIIDRIIAPQGKRLDESTPLVHSRLPDGSRVTVTNAVIANNGTTLTIIKRNFKPINGDDLARFGTLTPEALTVLKACVQAKCNIVITGLSSVGKTTLLNVLGNAIDENTFVITIEKSEELMLSTQNFLSLHTRPPNIENKGEITQQQLIQHSETMRPDYILIGEVDRVEAFDLINSTTAWLTTIRARFPYNALAKLESLYLMGEDKRPIQAIRHAIADAVNIIVHLEKFADSTHHITQICQVSYEDDGYTFRDLFRYERNEEFELPHIQGFLTRKNQPNKHLYERITNPTVDVTLQEDIRKMYPKV